jgi:hypothetical protein
MSNATIEYFEALYSFVRGETEEAPSGPCPARSRREAVKALEDAGWAAPHAAADLVAWGKSHATRRNRGAVRA